MKAIITDVSVGEDSVERLMFTLEDADTIHVTLGKKVIFVIDKNDLTVICNELLDTFGKKNELKVNL